MRSRLLVIGIIIAASYWLYKRNSKIAALGSIASGNLKVKLFDESGTPINGQIIAAKGSTVKTCATSAGSCTLYAISTGTWIITAKIGSRVGGPVYKTVGAGQTSTAAIQIILGGVDRSAACPPCPPC